MCICAIKTEIRVHRHINHSLVNRKINTLPDMPFLGSSNSAVNKDMTSKILTNGDTVF